MNRSFPSPHFYVHRHAADNSVLFALQQFHAPEIALRLARQTPDSGHFQHLMARIRDGTETVTSPAGSIGSFKLHKRPPPQRLPSCRRI